MASQLSIALFTRLRQLIAKLRLFWLPVPMKSTTYKRFSEKSCNGTFCTFVIYLTLAIVVFIVVACLSK